MKNSSKQFSIFLLNIALMGILVAVLTYFYLSEQIGDVGMFVTLLSGAIAFFCGMGGTAYGKYTVLRSHGD